MYYLKKNKKVFGPFPLEKLQGMVSSGMIVPENQISEDRANWVDAGRIKELFPDPSPTPMPMGKANVETVDKPSPRGRLGFKRDTKNETSDISGQFAEGLLGEAPKVSAEQPATEITEAPPFISMFWNPVKVFPQICSNPQRSVLVAVGLALWALSMVLVVIAAVIYGVRLEVLSLKTFCFLLGAIPFIPMVLSLKLMTVFFGSQPRYGAFPELSLLSGACLFPAAVSAFVAAAFSSLGILSQVQCLALLSGLGVYALSFAAIMVFNSCTRILGVGGQGTVFVVSTVLLVSAGSVALSLRFCLG